MWGLTFITSARQFSKQPRQSFYIAITQLFLQLLTTNEPPRGKTNNLHRRKQRRRSASW